MQTFKRSARYASDSSPVGMVVCDVVMRRKILLLDLPGVVGWGDFVAN